MSAGATIFEPETIRLRPPRPWGQVAIFTLIGAALLGLVAARWSARAGWVETVWQAFAVGGAVALALAVAGLALHFALRPRTLRTFVFGDTSVRLPAGFHSPRMLEVPYDRIFGLERMGRTRWPRLMIGVRGRIPISYLVRAFEQPDDADRLLALLLHRIAALPGSDAQLRAIEARHRIQERAFDGRFPLTVGLLMALVVVFGVEVAMGAPADATELARLGGQVPALVRGGEWWRLATASLLHTDLMHLYMNGVGLLALGFLLERLFGSLRFAWLLLVGVVTSGVASVSTGGHIVSVGASGAIFALIGAWLLLNTRFRDDLPPALHLPGWYIAVVAVLEIAFEALLSNIDSVAHAGGLVGGFAAAAIALPGRPLERAVSQVPRAVVLGTASLAAVFGACVGIGAWSVWVEGDAYATRFVALLLEEERPDAPESDVATNELAWLIATSESVEPEALALGVERMESVVERNPDEPHYLDTLATLHHRAGASGEAVALERRAFALASPGSLPLYAAQLARFHAQHLARSGVQVGDAWSGPVPTLEIVPARDGEPGDAVLQVALGVPQDQGARLEALVWNGEALQALLWIELAPQPDPTVRLTATDDTFAQLAEEEMRVELARVEAAEPLGPDGTPLQPGQWSWRAFPYLDVIAELP